MDDTVEREIIVKKFIEDHELNSSNKQNLRSLIGKTIKYISANIKRREEDGSKCNRRIYLYTNIKMIYIYQKTVE